MLRVRKAQDRGRADYGWLQTQHSFSFADYYDPEHMGFRSLRVINEDRIAAGRGFPKHPHRDMEILTVIFEGALAHEDSMGNSSTLRAGEVQRMTAGSGVVHSEFNPSLETTHLLQIWILSEEEGLAPGYEQRAFFDTAKEGALRLIASRGGREDSLHVHQDVNLYLGELASGKALCSEIAPGRAAWVQVVEGRVTVNEAPLEAGDAAALVEEDAVKIRAEEKAVFLLFDLS